MTVAAAAAAAAALFLDEAAVAIGLPMYCCPMTGGRAGLAGGRADGAGTVPAAVAGFWVQLPAATRCACTGSMLPLAGQ